MIDYKEEMALLFSRYYTNVGDQYQKKHMTTTEIDILFRGVMPRIPVSEHDVYEFMKLEGYFQEKVIIYEEKVIVEANPSKGIQEEVDLIPVGEVFKWVVYEKD